MKQFTPLQFSKEQALQEALQFRDLLAAQPVLKERKDVLPFFRTRLHLAALCGQYNLGISRFDRLGWEYDLFGDYACDLAVGDSVTKTYTSIEFEEAGPRSLFVRQGKKATRQWSPRLDQGYGQIIDWFCKLDDQRHSTDCENRFGKRAIDFTGVLIIGRDHDMDAGERRRFEWRREHVLVDSKRIHCVTFDEFLRDVMASLGGSLHDPLQGETA